MNLERARDLRRNASEAELRLWRRLRGRRFEGFKFRRQRPVGPYIVDFACLDGRLVVELDGGQHAEERLDYDRRRDAYLRRAGFRVVRIWNNEVMANIEGVLQTIDTALRAGPHPRLLPQAGERAQAASPQNPLPLAGEGRVRVSPQATTHEHHR